MPFSSLVSSFGFRPGFFRSFAASIWSRNFAASHCALNFAGSCETHSLLRRSSSSGVSFRYALAVKSSKIRDFSPAARSVSDGGFARSSFLTVTSFLRMRSLVVPVGSARAASTCRLKAFAVRDFFIPPLAGLLAASRIDSWSAVLGWHCGHSFAFHCRNPQRSHVKVKSAEPSDRCASAQSFIGLPLLTFFTSGHGPRTRGFFLYRSTLLTWSLVAAMC